MGDALVFIEMHSAPGNMSGKPLGAGHAFITTLYFLLLRKPIDEQHYFQERTNAVCADACSYLIKRKPRRSLKKKAEFTKFCIRTVFRRPGAFVFFLYYVRNYDWAIPIFTESFNVLFCKYGLSSRFLWHELTRKMALISLSLVSSMMLNKQAKRTSR